MICLSFDVEERFHSHLVSPDTRREWSLRDRIALILDSLGECGKKATFFVVGELAEAYPDLIRRMAVEGFEVGSHSYRHLRLDEEEQAVCREDISRSKKVLEDITGTAISGFRAPSWTASISDDWLWDHLVALGFRYDASLFPFRTHLYGSAANPVTPWRLRPELIEIPPSVSVFGRWRIPYGGGFYFRLYPRWLTRTLIDRDLRASRTPVAYFHPWEFETGPDRLEPTRLARFIGNYGVMGNWERFLDLIGRYDVMPLEVYREKLTEDSQATGCNGTAGGPRTE